MHWCIHALQRSGDHIKQHYSVYVELSFKSTALYTPTTYYTINLNNRTHRNYFAHTVGKGLILNTK